MKEEQGKVIPFPKEHDQCEACEKELGTDDIIWWAKDGKDYCDYCYDHVFYPEYYGFTRTDFIDGNAGYDVNCRPLHKVH